MQNVINVFYSEYGRYISRFRAIPFYIDCLKPVERRLLLVLHQKTKNNRFMKSARIVGDCIGKYHPHGDASTYGALVQLVNQGFASNEGGAWGTPSIKDTGEDKGSPPAAMRYTETKIERWVEELCMEYIDYVPWVELEMEEEPLYLPSPIPVGLVGDGIISGVAFHKTVIPKYSQKNLFKRLKWLLKNNIDEEKINWDKNMDEKIYGPMIIPFKSDCSIKEYNKNDFYRILLQGDGDLIYIPNGGISSEKIKRGKKTENIQLVKINGQAPNSTFKSLIKDAMNGILEIEQPLDNYNSEENHIEYGIIPKDKNLNINKFAQDIWEKYLIKSIKFKCFMCLDNGNISMVPIDTAIINSYNGWLYAWKIKLLRQIENVNEQIFINEICQELKDIISNNKKVNSFDDIKSKLKTNRIVTLSVLQKDKWIKQTRIIGIEDVEKIYNTSTIKKMIEYKNKRQELDSNFLEYKNTLDDIDNLAYKRICSYI